MDPPVPSKSPRTGTFGGRKFLTTADKSPMRPKSSQSKSMFISQSKSNVKSAVSLTQSAKKRFRNTNLDDLEKIIEANAAVIETTRREMDESQRDEICRVSRGLIALKNECDTLVSRNNAKERDLFYLNDDARSYETKLADCLHSDYTTNETTSEYEKLHLLLQEKITIEQTTKNMLQLMYNRMEKEIESIRAENDELLLQRESLHTECKLLSENLCRSRQELFAEEKLLDQITEMRRKRLLERNKKVKELKTLVSASNDEVSVLQIQNSSVTGSDRFSSSLFGGVDLTSPIRTSASRHFYPIPSGNVSRSAAAADGGDGDGDGANSDGRTAMFLDGRGDPDDDVVHTGQTAVKMQKVGESYENKAVAAERLLETRSFLQDRITIEKAKNAKLSELLDSSSARSRQLVQTNRQMHLEDEMKREAIAKAMKEMEEAKEKERALRANIDLMRRSLPRFLEKLTKKQHDVPRRDQLLGVIQKLNETVLNEIKDISAFFISESAVSESDAKTKRDAASKPKTHVESSLESDWVQKLPGFDEIRERLFTNIMTAKPDSSKNNVRVVSSHGYDKQRSLHAAVFQDGDSESSFVLDDDEDDPDADEFLDRSMIKQVAKLRIEKGTKVKKIPKKSRRRLLGS